MISGRLNTDSGDVGIIQIGLGLIGRAIDRELEPHILGRKTRSLDWSNIDEMTSQIRTTLKDLQDLSHITVIWSAGKAGFAATQKEVDAELKTFIALAQALKQSSAGHEMEFWLMSSAGGLHEGQICVSDGANVKPQRPYGWLKLQQEKTIQSLYDRNVICRISSVYTIDNLSGRLGLVAVLMINGIRHKVTTLVGSESTLRDYILDRDIAKGICYGIRRGQVRGGIHYLISGTPMSIKMIKSEIEQIIMKKLYLKYAADQSNAASITFLKSLRSPLIKHTSLSSNIKHLYNTIVSHQI